MAPWEDPFGDAARIGRERGTCPIHWLPDYLREHWDVDALCEGFTCPECVAEPADLGHLVDDDVWWAPEP